MNHGLLHYNILKIDLQLQVKMREEYINNFLFSNDKEKLDLDVIYDFISNSYWSNGITKEIVKCTVENSFCFGVYHNDIQIGFARVVTDFASFGYLADVFIIEKYQGKGLGKQLVEFILNTPSINNLRRLLLSTKDAHGLYTKFGFEPLKEPEKFLTIHKPDAYKI